MTTYDDELDERDQLTDGGPGPQWRCPQCASILQQPGPASRRDGRWEGWCPEHRHIAGVHGDRDTIISRALPCPWPIGQPVEVECVEGWRAGVVEGYRVDLAEDLLRIDVRITPHVVAIGAHPKHVRDAG